ncbi:c-type cytochrome biogenesis protein CcsB [Bogoriella caseilytica]|uniref:Cytochrome c-type biogenesis protein CcsB n=1 Tax=Bogoriella caseilytica TaxID=56055 RepID=A0A3N2BAN0_9MICO|nr:c-type cytochrome biogenesis protein CcsB [Bogoriella caseilytica]ROR72333.1 cytochrome c-type biogenesis protein CcsB [Bogoriella caseilytica]
MTDLALASLNLVYGAMAAYTVALVAFAIDLSGLRDRGPVPVTERPRRAAGIAVATTWLGAALHLGAVVSRAVATTRAPWANMYEFTLVSTFVAVAILLWMLRMRRDMRFLGVFVVGPTLLLLGVAVAVLYVQADDVMPALQSYWLVIHVSVATIATGVVTVAATLSVLQLVQERAERNRIEAAARLDPAEAVPTSSAAPAAAGTGTGILSGQPTDRTSWQDDVESATSRTGALESGAAKQAPARKLMSHLPSSADFERLAFRLNAIGFMLWTFTIIAGAIWAEHAWGRPWGWDPKETWSLIVWVIYAAYLHARSTRGWEGRGAAVLSILGFLAVMSNYFLVNLIFDSLHSYSGIG